VPIITGESYKDKVESERAVVGVDGRDLVAEAVFFFSLLT
jgi:hypothetical protein